jgi:peptide chain release factor 1
MFSRFENLGEKLLELEQKLADPAQLANQNDFRLLAKEHAHVTKLHELYTLYKQVQQELLDSKVLLKVEDDVEMLEMVKGEIASLNDRLIELEGDLQIMLLPKDPKDEKNILLEIRAGTGGDEAALFVSDLYRMYCRYAESKSWKVEVMSSNPIGIGGFKEIIVLIKGDKVYSQLKYESGVHRVQRVPATETQGRIHTSAVTVAVIPEAEEVELNIAPNELRFDVFRSSGPGGQSVNTTDSGVRVTHLPTGIIATCQDEKSQHKNKAAAIKVLHARLLDAMEREQHDKISADRKSQIGSGDRSERIRTYNFPQGRLTDHRINLTIYKLDDIMIGKLDDVIMPLIAHYQAEALKTLQ